MNTSRVELSSLPCNRFQRRRASATSGRSCSAARRVFFEGNLAAFEEMPHGGATPWIPRFRIAVTISLSVEIWMPFDEREQPTRMWLQTRRAPAPRLGRAVSRPVKALHPFDCRTWADIKLLGHLASRGSALHSCDHPHANIDGICLRHGSPPGAKQCPETYAFPNSRESRDSVRPQLALVVCS